MPVYEFMTDAGEIVEQMMTMADAPSIGTVCTVETDAGPVEATRIPSNHQVMDDPWKPYISNRLPRNLEGCPCTPSGKPIVTSRSQERNIMARHGFERE